MNHKSNRAVTALLCVAIIVISTGCSAESNEVGARSAESPTKTKHRFDTMAPGQIADQARKAVKNTTSMRLTGTANSEGRQVEADLAMDVRGSCHGTVGNSLGTMDIIKKGSLVHVKAGEDYWRATFSRGMTAEKTEEMVAHFKGRWIKPPRMMSEILGRVCNGLDALVGRLGHPVPDGSVTREADTTLGGRPVAVLTERTATESTTVYIAKEGKPYLLRARIAGGNEPVDLTFTDHNKPVDTTPPPPDQVLDPTTLR